MKALGVKSSESLIKDIFEHNSNQDNGQAVDNASASLGRARSSIRGVSVASQFKTSLQDLVHDLEQTQPHYIRCIKPNLKKAPNKFNSGEVLRQLRYAGMMEAIRIRREGYAHREAHESFYNRFSILLDSKDLEAGEGIAHLVTVLSKRLKVTDADWQIGHSKIFLRQELASKLEKLVSIRVRCAARIVGRFGRFIAQRRAANLLTAWAHLRMHLIREKRRMMAASKIQATFRMRKELKAFNMFIDAVVKVQAQARRIGAVNRVQKIRDPYGDLSFQELEKIHEGECSKLEKAIANKQYDLAADIEKTL